MKLTKSLFLTSLEAPLHLWLKFQDQLPAKSLSEYEQYIVEQGYEVEALAKEFLRKKVAAEYPAGSTIAFEVTLSDEKYEARLDALVHNVEDETYDLYEIKSSTTIHSEHKYDVTFQYLLAKEQLPLKHVFLVRVNNEYRRDGEIEPRGMFLVEDMAEIIALKETETRQLRHDAWNILRLTTMPKEHHCFNPKTCRYPSMCFPELPEYSIFELYRGSKKQYQMLQEMNIQLLRDIPRGFTQNYKQRMHIQSAKDGQPVIDAEGIQYELGRLAFPLYFLDYETYGPALPLHNGYQPYQQLVNQFSIHVARSLDTELEHFEFLATKPYDPSAELTQALCNVIGDTGTIIVWNKGFECGRNKELAVLQPAFAHQLTSINERTYDLMEIFSQGFYIDYHFHGSASIKKVLPILCPELSYQDLEIGEGTKAMMKWYEMVYGELDTAAKESIQQALLTYCKLDTLAMVKIWQKLKSLA